MVGTVGMMRLTVAMVACLGAGPGWAQDDGAGIAKVTVADMELMPNPNLTGVSAAFVQGAFDAEGVFVAASTMTAGSVFPAHAHPDARVTVVTAGTMYLGEGAAMDEDALVAYPAGTAAITPAGTMHFMVAQDGDFSVLEIGAGPSGTTFAE